MSDFDVRELNLTQKQYTAFTTFANEILYGGSSGSGKSHLMRYASIVWCLIIPGLQVYLFRRKYADLEKNHLYGPTGYVAMLHNLMREKKAKINYSDLRIEFTNGSQIYLSHCQHEKDKYNYQGAEIHVLMIDELTHFTKTMYTFLRSRVRLGGLKIDYDKLQKSFPYMSKGFFPRILCGTNPGGVGHGIFKEMFLDSAPPGEIHKTDVSEGGMRRQYIPALIYENPYLLDNDPDYMERLKGLGDKHLVHAMLTGDWDILAGGALDDVWKRQIHVIEPFDIPSDWRIDRSFDWGSAKPFACCWWAESNGNPVTLKDGSQRTYPRGTLFLIGELYGWTGEANVGARMSTREQGAEIKKYEDTKPWGHRVRPGPADSSIFDKTYQADSEESLHDHLVIGYNNQAMITNKEHSKADKDEFEYFKWNSRPTDTLFTRADKSPGSRIKGLEMIRTYLKAATENPMENKGLFIFNHCLQFIRTVPVIPRDEKNPEDVNSESEDHCLRGNTECDIIGGIYEIKDLVGTEGYIKSYGGLYHFYTDCKLTRKNQDIYRYEFDDGSFVECTPDHKFLTNQGWKEIGLCDPIDDTFYIEEGHLWKSKLLVKPNKSLMEKCIISVINIFRKMAKGCIELSGNTIMEKSQKDNTYIIWMGIGEIIKSKIWFNLMVVNIYQNILKKLIIPMQLRVLRKKQKNGIEVLKEGSGIKNNIKKIRVKFTERNLKFVSNVVLNLKARLVQNFVQINAKANGVENRDLIMSQRFVSFVDENLHGTNIIKQKLAVDLVGQNIVKPLKLTSIKCVGQEDVYCLNVPDTECFVVNKGNIVHNCFDAVRYRLYSKTVDYSQMRMKGI